MYARLERATKAMRAALDMAQMDPAGIGYINAHGTSTPLGDKAETTAIRSVFGEHAHKTKISSTKGALGHSLGASGGIGTAFLQLGKLANLTMCGLASKSKHEVLSDYGAMPIDYRSQDFLEVINEAEPGGLDAIFGGPDEAGNDRDFACV